MCITLSVLVGSAGGEIICLDYLVIFDRQEIYFLTIFFFHGIKCATQRAYVLGCQKKAKV